MPDTQKAFSFPMDTLTHWLTSYGALGLFVLMALGIVGVPIPEETTLTLAGFLVFLGHLDPLGAILAASLGSMVGISMSYVIGRTLGLRMVVKYGSYVRLSQDYIDKGHVWFERAGHWGLLMGYFIPGVRHLTAIAAGTTKLHYLDFALFAYAGAIVWSLCFITIGVYVGDKWLIISESIQKNLLVTTALVAAIITLAFLGRRIYRCRQRPSG